MEEKVTEKIGYRQILKQKEYCKIIFANLINRFGDSIDAIAFSWLVYQVTQSASWSAIIFALNTLPSILLQPLAGAAVERMNKKKLMVLSDLIRGIVVAVLAFIYVTGMVNPWILAVFTLVISSVEAFCLPASTAILPMLLEKKYYEFGMSLNSIGTTVMQLIGTGMAGVIIGALGVPAAIIIDTVTFLASAFVKGTIRVHEKLEAVADNNAVRRYFTDLKEGFIYMKHKRVFLNIIIMALFINAMLVPLNSFQTPLVVEVLHQDSSLLSVIGCSEVIAMGLGAFVYPYISKKFKVRTLFCINGFILSAGYYGMVLGARFFQNTLAVYITTAVAAFLLSGSACIMSSCVSVQFMKAVEPQYLARESALLGAGAMAAMPITSFFLGILVKYIPVRTMIIVCSLLCALIFLGIMICKMKLEEDEGDKIEGQQMEIKYETEN